MLRIRGGKASRNLQFNSNELILPGNAQGFLLGIDVEFAVNVFDMGFYRLLVDKKFGGDPGSAFTFRNALEDLGFPFRQGGLGIFTKGLDDHFGDVGAQGPAALQDFRDGFNDFGGRGVFGQIAGGPQAERFKNVLFIFINRKDDDVGGGVFFLDAGDRIEAVDAGQFDIQQDDIREIGNQVWFGFFVTGVAVDHFQSIRQVDQVGESFSDGLIVFDDNNAGDHDPDLVI